MDKEKLINLSYLKEIAGDEPDVMKEFIGLFLEQITEFRNDLQTCLKNRQWEELGKAAHKAKSSVMTFGLNDLGLLLKRIQLSTQEGGDVNTCSGDVAEFIRLIGLAEEELQQELLKL
jgi:HPt (histidine-containing phosphotransfer) domain-containing protein